MELLRAHLGVEQWLILGGWAVAGDAHDPSPDATALPLTPAYAFDQRIACSPDRPSSLRGDGGLAPAAVRRDRLRGGAP
jgi:hypothetical protein